MRGDSVIGDCSLGVRLWPRHARQTLVERCRTDMTEVRARTRAGALRRGVGPRHATHIRNEYKYIGKLGRTEQWGQASAYWRRASYTQRRSSSSSRTGPHSPFPEAAFQPGKPPSPRASPAAKRSQSTLSVRSASARPSRKDGSMASRSFLTRPRGNHNATAN